MREMVANQQMMAECVAIGLAIFAAVMAGSIAVAFVNLVTTFAAPLGMNRIYAIVLHRLNEILREKAT
jgi:hypothetical protein